MEEEEELSLTDEEAVEVEVAVEDLLLATNNKVRCQCNNSNNNHFTKILTWTCVETNQESNQTKE